MSIWCSLPPVGTDDMAETPQPRGGQVLTFAEGFSNHYPTTDGTHELPAHVGLASIAPWCVPGHNQDGDRGFVCTGCGVDHDHPQVGPWVRLTVAYEDSLDWWTKDSDGNPTRTGPACLSVNIDEDAARQLVADLMVWLEQPKVQPVEVSA